MILWAVQKVHTWKQYGFSFTSARWVFCFTVYKKAYISLCLFYLLLFFSQVYFKQCVNTEWTIFWSGSSYKWRYIFLCLLLASFLHSPDQKHVLLIFHVYNLMFKEKNSQGETDSSCSWISCWLWGQQQVCARECVAGEVCTGTCLLPLAVPVNQRLRFSGLWAVFL